MPAEVFTEEPPGPRSVWGEDHRSAQKERLGCRAVAAKFSAKLVGTSAAGMNFRCPEVG